jgi:hypothetical protein
MTSQNTDLSSWDILYTFSSLLGISNRFSIHQCPTECVLILQMILSFKRSLMHRIFFRSIPIKWDTDGVMLCSIRRRAVAPPGLIKKSMKIFRYPLSTGSYVFHVLNFHVEIFLILTCDLSLLTKLQMTPLFRCFRFRPTWMGLLHSFVEV